MCYFEFGGLNIAKLIYTLSFNCDVPRVKNVLLILHTELASIYVGLWATGVYL